MKLLLMGVGYVGAALLTYLQNTPHEIVITTTSEEKVDSLKSYGKKVVLLHPDDDLKDLIDSCDGMVILVAPNKSQSYEKTYLNTAKKIACALKSRQKRFYLLYTSSTSVCEGVEKSWVTEDVAIFPKSENAKILLAAEQTYLNCETNVCILRLGGIYGPKRELLDRARHFSGKVLAGTGDEPTNHIHLEDIVRAIAFCLDHSLTGIYHLVNEDHRARKELYSTLCQSIGIPVPIWDPHLSEGRKGGYLVANQKIKKAGFIFKHPFITTL